MTIRIEADANGHDAIWSEIGGKPVSLSANDLLICASTGDVLHASGGLDNVLSGRSLPFRLRPHEVAMVNYYFDKRGIEIKPNVFAGEPDG